MAEPITYLPNGTYTGICRKVIPFKGLLFELKSGLLVFCKITNKSGVKENTPFSLTIENDYCHLSGGEPGTTFIFLSLSPIPYKLFLTPEDIVEELL
jgi:hypothetical protein